MEITCIQKAMHNSYYERDSKRGLYATFIWLVEEIGELAEAIQKNNKKQIEEEIADIIAWTISIANLLNIDVKEALIKKYKHDLRETNCIKLE